MRLNQAYEQRGGQVKPNKTIQSNKKMNISSRKWVYLDLDNRTEVREGRCARQECVYTPVCVNTWNVSVYTVYTACVWHTAPHVAHPRHRGIQLDSKLIIKKIYTLTLIVSFGVLVITPEYFIQHRHPVTKEGNFNAIKLLLLL